jgi:galactose mutarotase-like enzyme
MSVEVMSWGATITSFRAQDGTDIVLGFQHFKGIFSPFLAL